MNEKITDDKFDDEGDMAYCALKQSDIPQTKSFSTKITLRMPDYSYIAPYFDILKKDYATSLTIESGICRDKKGISFENMGIFTSITFDLEQDELLFKCGIGTGSGFVNDINATPLPLNTLAGQKLTYTFLKNEDKTISATIEYGKYLFSGKNHNNFQNIEDKEWMCYLLGSHYYLTYSRAHFPSKNTDTYSFINCEEVNMGPLSKFLWEFENNNNRLQYTNTFRLFGT